jgi:hypothetical protein
MAKVEHIDGIEGNLGLYLFAWWLNLLTDKDLLEMTNLLLLHVGISAKQIISMKELVRVCYS